jgi:hypothetical protein
MVIVAGLIWGVFVFAFSTWIGLPIAATVFGAGEVSMPVQWALVADGEPPTR